MKSAMLALFTALMACSAHDALASRLVDTNPVAKVIEMLSELQQKIIGEGEAAQKLFDEYSEWCEEESKNLQYEIKTAKSQAEDLKATIAKAAADIGAADEEIEELSASISTDEADVKAAQAIRDKEQADFVAEEADLVDTVDVLGRAISIIEREMAKNPAFLQSSQKAGNLVAALTTLVEASFISSGDASRLTALVQSHQKDADSDEELGAPDPAAYKSHSKGIVDVLNDLLEKAEDQLAEARKTEATSQHNFDLVKLELDDSIKFSNKELDKTKKAKAEADGTKASAAGDLDVTLKGLSEDTTQLAETHRSCMEKATNFELETKSRAEELKALAEAKKVILEVTGGAASQTYEFAQSFLQIASGSNLNTRADLANFEAIKYVRTLSRRLGSTALAQLANRMAAAARFSTAAGDDPFAKVKGLISDMIERLLKEAEEEAAHKGYCDKEMAETKQKKDELGDEIDKLSTKIDKMSAESAQLKEEVATLQKELAELAKSQAEMDKVRAEEKEAFKTNNAEMEEGLEGVKLALKILRDYYAKDDKAHASAEGAGGGIISMLEVIESDFSKGLAELISTEDTAQAEYEQTTKENEIMKVTKEQDVKYKTKSHKSLDNSVAELTSDKDGAQSELDAVLDYWEKIKEQCIAKAEPYSERKKRREAEIAGLKEALAILEGEAVLLQKESTQRHKKLLRGVAHHAA